MSGDQPEKRGCVVSAYLYTTMPVDTPEIVRTLISDAFRSAVMFAIERVRSTDPSVAERLSQVAETADIDLSIAEHEVLGEPTLCPSCGHPKMRARAGKCARSDCFCPLHSEYEKAISKSAPKPADFSDPTWQHEE